MVLADRDVRNWRVVNVLSWLSEVIELPQYAQVRDTAHIDRTYGTAESWVISETD